MNIIACQSSRAVYVLWFFKVLWRGSHLWNSWALTTIAPTRSGCSSHMGILSRCRKLQDLETVAFAEPEAARIRISPRQQHSGNDGIREEPQVITSRSRRSGRGRNWQCESDATFASRFTVPLPFQPHLSPGHNTCEKAQTSFQPWLWNRSLDISDAGPELVRAEVGVPPSLNASAYTSNSRSHAESCTQRPSALNSTWGFVFALASSVCSAAFLGARRFRMSPNLSRQALIGKSWYSDSGSSPKTKIRSPELNSL